VSELLLLAHCETYVRSFVSFNISRSLIFGMEKKRIRFQKWNREH